MCKGDGNDDSELLDKKRVRVEDDWRLLYIDIYVYGISRVGRKASQRQYQ